MKKEKDFNSEFRKFEVNNSQNNVLNNNNSLLAFLLNLVESELFSRKRARRKFGMR